MVNKYEHFNFKFKGLDFEIKLIDDCSYFPNSEEIKPVEEFKIIVKNKDKEINYKFYNSIMEREISQILKENLKKYHFSQVKRLLKDRPLKMWGGYDKINTFSDFDLRRMEHLSYSVLNCFALDKETETDDFKFFCDNLGYNEDSIKALNIFSEVVKLKRKILSLNLTEEQEKYFNEEVNQETETFNNDLKKAIFEAKHGGKEQD
jgi:hypothetical protein